MEETEIDLLPIDVLTDVFVAINSFTDFAQASVVCKKWKQAVKLALGRKEVLSFAGWKMDDESTARVICHAYTLKELDISRSRWGCQITDAGLQKISAAKCISKLRSISLWGMTGITDQGVVQLISRAKSLQHPNIGGTFITDKSLFAIANSCPPLKVNQSFLSFTGLFDDRSPVELPSCDPWWTPNARKYLPPAQIHECVGIKGSVGLLPRYAED